MHGSSVSRLLDALGGAARVCFTVTLVDGIVFARSAFHHSINYRSVVVLGEAQPVTDPSERREALRAIVEHVASGRSNDVRGPSEQELAATAVVALALGEASAKIRTGPPLDAAEDYALAAWAGVVPLSLEPGSPITEPDCDAPIPMYAEHYTREVLPDAA
jgi:nitroimidazol reductase NimA-like FMN-containing flavoprotein (pyridoxamine 5'-phosphate oxidase superfamily)